MARTFQEATLHRPREQLLRMAEGRKASQAALLFRNGERGLNGIRGPLGRLEGRPRALAPVLRDRNHRSE